MQGQLSSEPEGIAGDCFYVLLMYDGGDGLTVAGLHEHIGAENDALGCAVPSREQVYRALVGLAFRKPPLTRKTGPRQDARWTVTDHGHAMLDVWVPDGEPHRPPCGLGWPS